MKLALVLAWLTACGGTAKPADPLHQASTGDAPIIASVELRGLSDRHRAAVTSAADEQLPTDTELTLERSENAHKAILGHYYERGHINVRVTWAEELERAKGRTPVVLTIDEGPVFSIASLDVKDVADSDRARYVALSTNRPGEPFVRSKISAWMQAVGDAAPGKPIVVPENSVDLVANTISVTLVLKNP